MPRFGEIIVIKRNGSDGTHFPLTATTCLFGRQAECDIRIQLPHVSKEHCRVEVKGNKEIFVTNLSTVNPAQLNGKAIQQPVRLTHGDVLTIIDRSFRFEEAGSKPVRRRSTGLGSDTYQELQNEKFSSIDETVELESSKFFKKSRKSEGVISKTTHTRRSLQITSSKDGKDLSPFCELYEIFKSKVESKSPVKAGSPKNVRSEKAESVPHTPDTPKRASRGQANASVGFKEVRVDVSNEASGSLKSPGRGRRSSLSKQNKDAPAIHELKANVHSKQQITHISKDGEKPRTPRSSSRSSLAESPGSPSPGNDTSIQNGETVNPRKQSPRRLSAGQSLNAMSPANSKSVPGSVSPQQKRGKITKFPNEMVTGGDNAASPSSRRLSQKSSAASPKVSETKAKSTATGSKKSPRKRRSDELSLPEPPSKRKRVSFGGHLSPELFDKHLPPNSPLKRGATPARRSLSTILPRAVIRKSFGLKHSAIKEVQGQLFAQSGSSALHGSPFSSKVSLADSAAWANLSPSVTPSKSHAHGSPKSQSKTSVANKSPSKRSSTPVKASPGLRVTKRSPDTSSSIVSSLSLPSRFIANRSSITVPGKRLTVQISPAKNQTKSPSEKSPAKRSPAKDSSTNTPAKRSPAKASPAKRSPAKVTPTKRSPAKVTPAKRSPAKVTPAKRSPAKVTPAKRSPAKVTPGKRSPAKVTPGKRSLAKASPARTPAKASPARTPAKTSPARTPAKMSPARTPAKMSPARTPAKMSPARTPAKTSPARTPAKSSPAKASPARTPAETPAKRYQTKESPARTPAKWSPAKVSPAETLAKVSLAKVSPAKVSPAKVSPAKVSPAKVSPAKVSPAKVSPAKVSPAKVSPAKASHARTPAKRSPAKASPMSFPAKASPARTPAKRSPAKASPARTPAKRSPAKASPARTPAKRSPAKASPARTPAKRSPAKASPARTPAKRSPAKASPARTPAKRSPAKASPARTPAKRSPAKASPARTPAKRSPAKASPARTPATRTPAKASPAVPYTKGRFSISRAKTPPQAESVSSYYTPGIAVSQTPKSRKSFTLKKTPARRSRKLDALEVIRARRRTGATEANLLLARSWADIVKIGVAKPQKKNYKPALKVKITKKKKAIKTPLKKAKALSSTGHADSPATILIGRAHTRSVNITGHAPKVVRNPAAKINIDQDESFTGMAQLFSTPVSTKQRRSVRKASNDTGTPRSAVYEMSVVKTPEESGEMVVSPMNSLLTTQRKKYSQEAVSRLLRSPVSLELLKDQEEGNTGSTVTHSEATAHKPEEAESYSNKGKRSKTPKEKRKTMNLTGIKRLMKTPKQRGTPITDPVALKKMLRTPTFVESLPVANTRRSAKLDDLVGVKNLMKTPKQKGEPVLGFMGIQRIMKTPRQKGEPVEDLTGIKRIMRTPKQKGEPVEDMVGIKRIMTTPKEKSQSLEDMEGVSRLMSTPTENTHPIEEIFGIRQLIKTPPKKTAVVKEVLGIANHTPTGSIESTELVRTKSKTLSLGSERGISTKRLSENVEIQKLHEHVPSGEINTPQPRKRGRPSKTTGSSVEKRTQGALNNAEKPVKVSNSQTLATTKRRSRSSTNVEIHEHLPASGEMKTTQPQKRGRTSKSTGLSADNNTQKALNDTHNVQETVKVSDAETEPSTRRSRSSSNAEKHSLHEPVVSADGEMKTTQAQKRGRPSKSTGLSADNNTQKALNDTHNVQETVKVSDAETEPSTRRSRSSSNAEKHSLHEPVVSADGEMKTTQAQKRGRPSKSTGLSAHNSTQKALNDTPNVQETVKVSAETEPSTRRSRSSSNAEKQTLHEPVVSADGEMKTTPPRKRGRPSKNIELPAENSTQKALNTQYVQEQAQVTNAETETSKRRSRSTTNVTQVPGTSLPEVNKPAQESQTVGSTKQRQARGKLSGNVKESLEQNDVNVKSPPAKRRGRPVKDILPESLGNKATEQPASPPSKSRSAGSKSPKKTLRQSKNVQIETQESKVLVNQEPENSVPKRKGRFTKSSVKDVIPSEQLPQDHQDNSAVTVSSRSSNRKTAKSHNIPKRITHATANQQNIQSSSETHLKVSLQENVELQVVESVKQTELGKHTASKTRSRRNVQTAGAAENLPVTEPEQSKDEPAPVEKAVGRRTVRNKSLQVANEQSSVSEVVNLSTTQPEESTEKTPVEKAIVRRAGRRKNIEEVIEQLSGLKGNLKSAQGRVFKTTSATEAKKSQSAEEEQPALTKSRRQKGHTAVNIQTKKSRAKTAENAGESAGVQHFENSSATSESAPIESPVKSTNVTQPARRGRFAKVKDVVPAPEAEVNESKRFSDFASKVVVLEETSSSIVISKNVKGRRKDQSKDGTFLVSKSESTTVEHVESTKTINKRSMRGKKDLPPAEDLHTDADATLRQSRRAKQILQPLDGERGLNQKSSKNRAVQWRTPVANQGTSSESRESSHTEPETSSKVSTRGKSKESAEELIVPSKRSRRNAGVEENGTTDTERPSEEAKVSPAKSGKKVAKKQTPNIAVPVVVDGDILKPKGRGRGAVSKSLVQENNEVAGSTLPKKRGRRAAVQAPSQDVVISPHKTVDKDVLENADPVDRIPKSRRAVKRKANSTEPADEGSVVSAKTSKKPAVPEESPAKKNKTEGTTSSTQKSGKPKSASKSENKKAVKETTARTTRASARTRK